MVRLSRQCRYSGFVRSRSESPDLGMFLRPKRHKLTEKARIICICQLGFDNPQGRQLGYLGMVLRKRHDPRTRTRSSYGLG